MGKGIAAALVVIGLVAFSTNVARGAEATTSPGKFAVFVSEDAGNLVGSYMPTPLTGTILKGKKKRVLRVEAGLTVQGAASVIGSVYVRITVNGDTINPGEFLQAHCANASATYCSAIGTWWLDLDAAEAANPGTIINQPLTISLVGGADAVTSTTQPYAASFSAQLVKK